LSAPSSAPPSHLPSSPTRRSSDLDSRDPREPGVGRVLLAREYRDLLGFGGIEAAGTQVDAVLRFERRRDRRHAVVPRRASAGRLDRKSTRLNSSHVAISYAVFCLK